MNLKSIKAKFKGRLLAASVVAGLASFSANAQITDFPWVEEFDGAAAWTFVNGEEVNKWYIGSATGNPANSLYVSDDDGTSNNYNVDEYSVVHAYADISFPAGMPAIDFSFDWICGGEGTAWDYMRVWVVPTTFTPTAGTQITAAGSGGDQYGGNHLEEFDWITESHSFPASYAGTTKRLIFEWKNDGSYGDQPPPAIDNINIVVSSCVKPSALTVTNVTDETASLGWTEDGSATEWRVEYGPAGFTPGSGTSALTTENPYDISGLSPLTAYDFYVRSLCTDDSSALAGPKAFSTSQVPADLPFEEDWDGTNEWEILNGTYTNIWEVGDATGNPANALYISNDGGATNGYTISSASGTVHAFRDIYFPADVVESSLSFDWQSMGEASWDYLRAWIVPTSFTPTPGTLITTAASGGTQYGGNFGQSSAWTTQTYLLPASYAGQVMRLVFEWRNDGSGGTQPPAAVDNINVIAYTCPRPVAPTAIDIESTTATLSWTEVGAATEWSLEYGPVGFTPGSGTFVTKADTFHGLSSLTANTTYDFYVRSICSDSDSSALVGPTSFTTEQIPADIPYEEDWSDGTDWTIVNGNATNKWYIGSAVGNPVNSAYITNDAGISNAYTVSGAISVVQVYRDVTFPAGTTSMNLSFDWRNDGEDDYDYLRVWVTPTTFRPVAGTQTDATTSGGTQYGGNFQLEPDWTSESFALPASYEGQTLRFIFEWRNDNSVGDQPPGAIDNINITGIVPCPAPTDLAVSDITANTATLTWSSVEDPTSWEVNYGPPGYTAGTGTIVTASASPYTVTGLIPATPYDFYIRSVCPWGTTSAWIGPITDTTDCILPEITSVTNDTICGPGYGILSATATTGATIEWFEDAALTTLVNTGASFETPDLASSTNYYVVAVLSAGICRSESEIVRLVVNPLPIANIGNDTAICDLTSITLSTPTDADYSYLWNTGDTSSSIIVAEAGNYSVTVTDENNCVNTDDVDVAILPLPTVEGFNFVPLFEDGTRNVRFEVIDPMNVTGYLWDFGDGATSTEANPTHEFGLDAAYGVTLIVSNGCGNDTVSLNINVDITTGITQLSNSATIIQLYPNPSQNVVTISNDKNIRMQGVTVYNTLGAVVFKGDAQGSATYKLSVADFASGMYTVMIQTEQGAVIRKIQVVH